ncbi:MAG: glutamate-5-semialdehyde dehydrogenase [Lachnospiraceae bacterium]|nr:glutamate-5-semialdehyde dehydrogenase [Lachnospiraceae bacterium]
MADLNEMGRKAKEASALLSLYTTEEKNRGLETAARVLLEKEAAILAANSLDVEQAEKNGVSPAMIDRLRLNHDRIAAMAEGLTQIVALADPIGEVLESFSRPNGLQIKKVRVPLGVIGIIYESRPNVTADAFGLCFKSGNAVILRGGSDALCSNQAIVAALREALSEAGLCPDALQLMEDTSREAAAALMRLNRYVDVLIPRGGAGLIRTCLETTTVPCIETGTGNCHIYVDESADLSMAVEIIDNAKTQRMGVCNACESLLVHEAAAKKAIPLIYERLTGKHVEIRAGERVFSICGGDCPDLKAAVEEDFATEFLGPVISLQIVSDIDEAIAHINRYSTHHSDAIITENAENAEKFLNGVDAAAVYVNASTRFTDGFEFGFGAEIGISTQKLHARGPMGLKELTSYKYQVRGNGQIRG